MIVDPPDPYGWLAQRGPYGIRRLQAQRGLMRRSKELQERGYQQKPVEAGALPDEGEDTMEYPALRSRPPAPMMTTTAAPPPAPKKQGPDWKTIGIFALIFLVVYNMGRS